MSAAQAPAWKLDYIALRVRDSRAQCMTIHSTGIVRVVYRWGLVEFPTDESFAEWMQTGQLPSGARTKFTDFDPTNPN